YWTTERPRGAQTHYNAVRRMCRERGVLFEDPEFPPGPRALYHHKKPAMHPIVWMRPGEMCQRPRFITSENGNGSTSGAGGGGAAEGGRLDVEAGEMGDPWLLAAISSLTLTPRFLDRVVPPDQTFDPATYCGVFRFRFWHFGEWKDVLVDDRLPTYRGRLIYTHCTNPTEFWAALLEKAYANFMQEDVRLSFTEDRNGMA
ncbi:hypothetical protein L9F63_014583, partial [Diploptera punctata]